MPKNKIPLFVRDDSVLVISSLSFRPCHFDRREKSCFVFCARPLRLAWTDVAVSLALAALFLRSAPHVLRESIRELRAASN